MSASPTEIDWTLRLEVTVPVGVTSLAVAVVIVASGVAVVDSGGGSKAGSNRAFPEECTSAAFRDLFRIGVLSRFGSGTGGGSIGA